MMIAYEECVLSHVSMFVALLVHLKDDHHHPNNL